MSRRIKKYRRWIKRLMVVLLLSSSGWSYVPQELGDALAEGDSEAPAYADTRNWEACIYKATSDFSRMTVICPDGYVERN